jgi:hypothetical protein
MEGLRICGFKPRPDVLFAVAARRAERERISQVKARRCPRCGVGGFDLVHCHACGYRGTWLDRY